MRAVVGIQRGHGCRLKDFFRTGKDLALPRFRIARPQRSAEIEGAAERTDVERDALPRPRVDRGDRGFDLDRKRGQLADVPVGNQRGVRGNPRQRVRQPRAEQNFRTRKFTLRDIPDEHRVRRLRNDGNFERVQSARQQRDKFPHRERQPAGNRLRFGKHPVERSKREKFLILSRKSVRQRLRDRFAADKFVKRAHGVGITLARSLGGKQRKTREHFFAAGDQFVAAVSFHRFPFFDRPADSPAVSAVFEQIVAVIISVPEIDVCGDRVRRQG